MSKTRKPNIGRHEAEFHQRVDQKVQAGLSRPDAVKALVAEDPGLHMAYLAEYNERRGYPHGALSARRKLASMNSRLAQTNHR